ncbi:MAG: hypothetical protein WKF40_10975 [Thermoleophilaceae bacterium]
MISEPAIVWVTFSWKTSETLPSAWPLPQFHPTRVPLRICAMSRLRARAALWRTARTGFAAPG